jgi:hypothetical protein
MLTRKLSVFAAAAGADASVANQRTDASDTIWFERELEHIRARTYDVKRIPLRAREVFPMDFEVNEGAEIVTYRQYDMVGTAKVIAKYANDLPRVDITGKEFSSRVKGLGDAYGYSVQDIRAARMAGKPLEQRRADAARRAIAELENRVAFFGDNTNGILGFLGNPYIPRLASPVGAATTTPWSTKTAAEMLEDLNTLGNYASDLTNGVETADTLLIPVAQYNLIHSTYIDTFHQKTVARAFLDASPYIKSIMPISELKGAAHGSKDMAVAYRKDPNALQMVIPMEFLQHAAQQRGLEWEIACEERFGGVVVYYPLSVVFMEGI